MLLLEICISTQTLSLIKDNHLIKKYVISTAKNGMGEEYGSEKTPLGWHIIRAKIGTNAPANTVFIRRRSTGEIFIPEFIKQFPERDWILTRILWLSGLEIHKNRLGNVDSMRRKIYIHGSPDQFVMGTPESKGCIRMRNHDVIELFDTIPVGTRVLVKE
ncbi:MAG: L,D-transpeptidase [Gammaproteobacteria bacterium]|nr:L,D-transpeptidase [Gammaproteobacteria bacterium]